MRRVAAIAPISLCLLACSAANTDRASNDVQGARDGEADRPTLDASLDDGASADAGQVGDAGGHSATGDAGGSGPPDLPPISSAEEPYKAGSRLKPRFLVTSDGLREFETLIDTKLGIPCEPAHDTDGQLRCLPVPAASASFRYEDPECQNPALFISVWGCDGLGDRFVRSPHYHEDCAERFDVLDVGDEFTPEGSLYHTSLFGSGCYGEEAGDGRFFRAKVMAPAEFVALERRRSETRDGMWAEYVEGEDGSRMLTGLADERWGTCYFNRHDAEPRCEVPYMGINDHWVDERRYSDSACSKPIGVVGTKLGCPAPPFVHDLYADDLGCFHHRFFARGEPLATTYAASEPELPDAGPGACYDHGLISSGGSERVFELGEEAGPDTFVKPQLLREGGTRLAAQKLKHASLPALRDRTHDFYDRDLDEPCRLELARDGKMRCIPGSIAGIHYTDAECTKPVVGQLQHPCITDRSPYVKAEVANPERCAPRLLRAFRVGSPIARPAEVYSRGLPFHDCRPFNDDRPFLWFEALELAPDELVEVSPELE